MKKANVYFWILLIVIFVSTSCAHIPSTDKGGSFSDYTPENFNELLEAYTTGNDSRLSDNRVVIEAGGDSSSGTAGGTSFEIMQVIKDNQKSATVKIFGKTIDGAYLYTRQGKYYSYEIDYYEYTNDNEIIQFGINTNSKGIDYYSWMPMNGKIIDDTNLSEGECRAIAETFLIENAFSTEEYQMIKTKYREIPEYGGLYTFEFDKTIQGTRTSEKAYISVTPSGTIVSWNFVARNSIDISAIDSGWNKTESLKRILSELDEQYSKDNNSFETEYSVKDVTLCRMVDGNYYFVFSVEICFTSKTESVKGYTDLISVLLQLTE